MTNSMFRKIPVSVGDLFIVKKRKLNNQVSTEQIRAFIDATYCVLKFYKFFPKNQMKIYILEKMDDPKIAGRCDHTKTVITIGNEDCRTPDDFLTVVIHECIHSCKHWPKSEEKIVSTLTSKIKSQVNEIANILLQNCYRTAAFFAHTKLSYVTDGPDYYDENQYRKVGVKPKFHIKKKKKLLFPQLKNLFKK